MNLKRTIGIWWITTLFGLAAGEPNAAAKPIFVHYMPWFVAKPYSASWGWHWTMNHYNPDTTNASGDRLIASQYYPLIGPYDSADPAVLEYHVLLIKLGGIDGVLVKWDGNDNFLDYAVNNTRMAALFEWTRKAGLKFGVVYEDYPIQREITDRFISASNAIAHARQQLIYLETNYFADGSYLRRDGKPVLLNFGPQYFTASGDWTNIFAGLAASNQPPAFFNEDNRLAPAALGAFNWPPMWLSQTNGGVLSPAQLESYLSQFDQKAASWPASISGAWPRFHDIYAQAGVQSSYGYLADDNGDTFRRTLWRSLTNASAYIQIVTWNDFGEGTVIEPTKEFGYRDLGIIQDLRRQAGETNHLWSPSHLTIPRRLFDLRRQYTNAPVIAAELDRVFANTVAGNLAAAEQQLTGIETHRLALYDATVNNGQIRFSVGGYLRTNDVVIQTTSNLTTAAWLPVSTNSTGTNKVVFSTNLPSQTAGGFFRALSTGP